MRLSLLTLILLATPAFAHDHNPEEIVEAAIYRKAPEGVRAPITDLRTVNPNRVAFHIAHGEVKTMVNQQGRVITDSDSNTNARVDPILAMISNGIRRDFYQRSPARSRVERMQGLVPRPPVRSVLPELGGIVVVANQPSLQQGHVELRIDLDRDLSISID